MAQYGKAVTAGLTLIIAMSPVGLETLKKYEGLRTHAYADPYHGWRVATICYGHTKGVRKGDVATEEMCNEWLEQDANKHCKIVYDALAPHNIWLTQGEQDAYCSFAYNLGQFKNTPSVYGRLVQGDDWGACEGLLKYTYSNGQYSRGLYNRRMAEYKLCVSDLER